VVVYEPPPEPGQKHVSHEAVLLKALQASIADLGVVGLHGQGAANRFDVNGWGLQLSQQFQYGDLRIELADTTLIVEAESAGGVGNLVKYWPLLRSGTLAKRLVILHLYMLGSNADYIAHRKLWCFLVDRMTEDLVANGVGRPERWDAQLITYRKGGSLGEVTALLRKTVMESGHFQPEPTVPTGPGGAARANVKVSSHAADRLSGARRALLAAERSGSSW
jgi:hypothetical protein